MDTDITCFSNLDMCPLLRLQPEPSPSSAYPVWMTELCQVPGECLGFSEGEHSPGRTQQPLFSLLSVSVILAITKGFVASTTDPQRPTILPLNWLIAPLLCKDWHYVRITAWSDSFQMDSRRIMPSSSWRGSGLYPWLWSHGDRACSSLPDRHDGSPSLPAGHASSSYDRRRYKSIYT